MGSHQEHIYPMVPQRRHTSECSSMNRWWVRELPTLLDPVYIVDVFAETLAIVASIGYFFSTGLMTPTAIWYLMSPANRPRGEYSGKFSTFRANFKAWLQSSSQCSISIDQKQSLLPELLTRPQLPWCVPIEELVHNETSFAGSYFESEMTNPLFASVTTPSSHRNQHRFQEEHRQKSRGASQTTSHRGGDEPSSPNLYYSYKNIY